MRYYLLETDLHIKLQHMKVILFMYIFSLQTLVVPSRSVPVKNRLVPLFGIKVRCPITITPQVMTRLKWLFCYYCWGWCQDDDWHTKKSFWHQFHSLSGHAWDNFCLL